MDGTDNGLFGGPVAQIYQQYLVPMLFEPYAIDLARQVARRRPARVLELAAGTGALTRQLARTLGPGAAIVATDLSQAMLDQATALATEHPVEWRRADATALPFASGEFDVVVCQFAVMLFADKPQAFAEARRVLRRGGWLVFSVWDRLEENEFADVVTQAMNGFFPDDPPSFLPTRVHGYHDRGAIEYDLGRARFERPPEFVTLAARSRAESPHATAVGYCQGTPLRAEIAARDAARLDEATEVAAAAVAARFGPGAVDGKMQGHVISVER